MDSIQQSSFLFKTIKWLSNNRKFHICIHDTSGVLHSNTMLSLPVNYTIHSCTFCDCAKTSPVGMRTCLKCKTLSIKKALDLKETFIGQCYLGITEIIKPVFYNDKLICIIYLGNLLLEERKFETVNRIERICSLTDIDSKTMIKALDTMEFVSQQDLADLSEVVEVLCHHIQLTINDTTRLRAKTYVPSPVYRNTNHWVITSVQNYISTYYNRDIRLSQLAKLYFLNPQYLCRLFKSESGTNFSDYVNNTRIMHAKLLLRKTEDEIVDISFKVGFNNVTYFNRLFKKITGVTPGDYRKKNIETI